MYSGKTISRMEFEHLSDGYPNKALRVIIFHFTDGNRLEIEASGDDELLMYDGIDV
jgi:hypothetical protein